MAYIKKIAEVTSDELSDHLFSRQVYVNDITWNKNTISSYQARRDKTGIDTSDLPKQLVFDIPSTVIDQISKDPKNENDIVEQFIYNTLSRKYMHEVWHCQIWILF